MLYFRFRDFDLEAQIATLPACAVENMGRKRGFARQRHNSECMHSNRKSESDNTNPNAPGMAFVLHHAFYTMPHF